MKHKHGPWYAYLLVALIVPFVSTFWIRFVTRPKRDERFSLFLTAYTFDQDELKKRALTYEKGNILEVNFDRITPHDRSFDTYYQTVKESEDAFILPLSDVEGKKEYLSFYAPIEKDYVKEMLGDKLEFYSLDEKDYGIKVFDGETGWSSDIIQYLLPNQPKEDYYLFFSSKSPLIGKLNGSQKDDAFYLLKGLIPA